jgi:O-acetyl-ADP-ribose deacetylase (regulator of RNase III)
MYQQYRVGKGTLVLAQGDITREETEAIANAANGALLGGGGVDGAIHRAAGPELLAACQEVKKTLPGGRLATGQAVLTPAFMLKAKKVIHCVGPVYAQAGRDAPKLLESCYAQALRLCRENGIRSIAFPSISTGIYGYPVDRAAPVALGAVKQALEGSDSSLLVKFVLFDEDTFRAYADAAERLFGSPAAA